MEVYYQFQINIHGGGDTTYSTGSPQSNDGIREFPSTQECGGFDYLWRWMTEGALN